MKGTACVHKSFCVSDVKNSFRPLYKFIHFFQPFWYMFFFSFKATRLAEVKVRMKPHWVGGRNSNFPAIGIKVTTFLLYASLYKISFSLITVNKINWKWNIDLRKSHFFFHFSIIWILDIILLIIRKEYCIHCMPCSSRIMWDDIKDLLPLETMELQIDVLGTLAESYLGDATQTTIWCHSCYRNIYDVIGIGAWQTVCARLRHFFSMTLLTEILSTLTSDFLKQMSIRNLFNSVF